MSYCGVILLGLALLFSFSAVCGGTVNISIAGSPVVSQDVSVKLVCATNSNSGDVHWLQGGEKRTETTRRLASCRLPRSSRSTFDTECDGDSVSLTIKSVTEQDSGNWACKEESTGDTSSAVALIVSRVTLEIRGPDVIQASSDVTFVCNVTQGVGDVWWYQKGTHRALTYRRKSIPCGFRRKDSGEYGYSCSGNTAILVVRNVNQNDTGDWTCQERKTKHKSNVAKLEISDEPRPITLRIEDGLSGRIKGDDVTLICERNKVFGDIEWLQDGDIRGRTVRRPHNQCRYTGVEYGMHECDWKKVVLHLENVKANYSGEWSCRDRQSKAVSNAINIQSTEVPFRNCYKDSWNRLINDYIFKDGKMTIRKCLTGCAERFYKYAGLEGGKECFCGNDVNWENHPLRKQRECRMKCPGAKKQQCGGLWKLMLFHLQ